MSLPALIRCTEASAARRVAALTVLDRLVVAAHRAGCPSITIVHSGQRPDLKRSSQMGIEVRQVSEAPPFTEPVLVLETRWLLQAVDLRRVMDAGSRLVARDGTLLPVGVLSSGRLGEETATDPFRGLPEVTVQSLALPVGDADAARAATRALWASMGSSTDGTVDRYFNRPLGRLLSRVLVHTAVSPNQVSVVATLMGLCSAWLFSLGTFAGALWGAIVLQLSAVVDCVDGELARVLFKESPLGKWLDIVGDQVVHIGIFTGIGLGLWRAGSHAPVLVLSASAVIGVVLSFLVVMRGLRQPEAQRNRRLQKLIDATTNRDFSVLLLFLVLLGHIQWFLWMTAVGVHVFWLAALAVQCWNPQAEAGWETRRENRS